MVISIGNTPPGASTVAAEGKFNASGKQRGSRLAALALIGASLAAGTALRARQQKIGSLTLPKSKIKKRKLSNLAVDAICGAIGEVTSLVALYPLDTIKVQCQARGVNAGTILKDLARLPPGVALRSLYAGVGSAAIGAGLVGSLYLVAFFAAKRVGTEICQRRNMQGSDALIASSSGVAASLVGSLLDSPIEHFKVRTQAGAGAAGEPMLMALTRTATMHGFGQLYYSFLPFLLKSIPHDVAELVTFSSLNDMRRQSLATGAAAEAAASQESTSKAAMSSSSSWHEHAGQALARFPESIGDMVIGAAAGAAAAAASMPCDVIFTQMNLNSACLVPGSHSGRPSVVESASLFMTTGRQIIAQGGGYRALFVGIVPRLMQTVPAGVVYWLAVESTRRALRERYEIPSDSAVVTMATASSSSGSNSSNFCSLNGINKLNGSRNSLHSVDNAGALVPKPAPLPAARAVAVSSSSSIKSSSSSSSSSSLWSDDIEAVSSFVSVF